MCGRGRAQAYPLSITRAATSSIDRDTASANGPVAEGYTDGDRARRRWMRAYLPWLRIRTLGVEEKRDWIVWEMAVRGGEVRDDGEGERNGEMD